MRILGYKPGHDGSVALTVDGKLVELLEAEKDSGLRYARLSINDLFSCTRLHHMPEAFALSGWPGVGRPAGHTIGSGYYGLQPPTPFGQPLFEGRWQTYSSSHERSHIFCSYALSPFEQGARCYCLLWEGYIGSFYLIDERVNIRKLADIMAAPGLRYAFAYTLADAASSRPRLGDAGKLMALAAYDNGKLPLSVEEQECLRRLFLAPQTNPTLSKANFSDLPFFNCKIGSLASMRLARIVSDYILTYFFEKMRECVSEHLPLIIGGGCGLNCDWNRFFLDSGLFSDVFVPPVTNDIGSSIGTAADVQHTLTGHAKIEWDIYSGQDFFDDVGLSCLESLRDYKSIPASSVVIAKALKAGAVLGWVSGRMEIGPRALGNRSIFASPFSRQMTERLNTIKRREQFRPIAPICLEEDASALFDLSRPSPHMLYFARSKTDYLAAVTHVDGSARVQTVSTKSNPVVHQLLSAFKSETGFGVLCNTSLNFNGCGFINRTSDLIKYADENGLDGFFVNGAAFLRTPEKFGM